MGGDKTSRGEYKHQYCALVRASQGEREILWVSRVSPVFILYLLKPREDPPSKNHVDRGTAMDSLNMKRFMGASHQLYVVYV